MSIRLTRLKKALCTVCIRLHDYGVYYGVILFQ
jgi:hypothetical protein